MDRQLPYTLNKGTLLLRIKALPNAGRNQIAGVRGNELVVRVRAHAQKGEANRELLRFLAKSLRLPRSSLEIVTGETSAHKVVRLPSEESRCLEPFLHPED